MIRKEQVTNTERLTKMLNRIVGNAEAETTSLKEYIAILKENEITLNNKIKDLSTKANDLECRVANIEKIKEVE